MAPLVTLVAARSVGWLGSRENHLLLISFDPAPPGPGRKHQHEPAPQGIIVMLGCRLGA